MPLVPVGIFSAYSLITPSGNGYIAGGYGASSTTSINKLSFLSESISNLSAVLTSNGSSYFGGSASNTGTAGYCGKGRDGTTTGLDKILFSTDTVSFLANQLSTGSYGYANATNVGVAGYWAGGTAGGRNAATVDKFSYSSETASITTSLAYGGYYTGGFSNTGVAGYFSDGGYSTGFSKFLYPSDTRTVISASNQTIYVATFENTAIAGYQLGGGSYLTRILKTSFTSDTTYTSTSTLSVGKIYGAGLAHTQVAGYYAGGELSNFTKTNVIEKILFNSDTKSTISATLSSARYQSYPLQNGGII